MELNFHGADKEVTGSCHLLKVNGKNILIDCGMFQGSDFNTGKNFSDFNFNPHDIDAVLVTHAHIDHIGRLPKLVRQGFKHKIYLTKGTYEIAELIWNDAYNVMKYNNKKFSSPILFDTVDIGQALSQCHPIDYNEEIEIFPEIKAVWKDAGHVFGSAFIEIKTTEGVIAFSGDIGNENVPILKDTEQLGEIDYLVIESTYGDRVHEDIATRKQIIYQLIKEGVENGGTIMVPAFSLERTQELLYELNILSEYDKILPDIPIFLDSPLSIDMVHVFEKYPDYYDVHASRLYMSGDNFLDFPNLKMTYTKEESKMINHVHGAKMVIAGAGMMNGGRILHHALRYLSDPKSTLLIVGYQAKGTLGRKIYDGAKTVRIFNEKVDVNCVVKAIGALSAHGDQNKLTKWVKHAKKKPKKVFCVHGEERAVEALAKKIKNECQTQTFIPNEGDKFILN